MLFCQRFTCSTEEDWCACATVGSETRKSGDWVAMPVFHLRCMALMFLLHSLQDGSGAYIIVYQHPHTHTHHLEHINGALQGLERMRLKSSCSKPWWLIINVSTCPTQGSWACLNHFFFVVSLSLTTNKEISLSFHVPGSPLRWVLKCGRIFWIQRFATWGTSRCVTHTLLRVEQLEHQACLQPANICTVAWNFYTQPFTTCLSPHDWWCTV